MDDTQRQRIADACRFIDSIRENVVTELRVEEQIARSNASREQHKVGHFSLLVAETLLFQASAILRELSEWSRLKNGPSTRDTTLQRMQLAALEDCVSACFSVERAQAKKALRALWKGAPVTEDLIIGAIDSSIAGRDKGGEPALVDLLAEHLSDVTNVHVRNVVSYAAASAASERAKRRPSACLRPGWLSEDAQAALEREPLLSFALPAVDGGLNRGNVMVFIGDVRDTGFSVVAWMPKPRSCTAEEVRAGVCRQFGLPPGGVVLDESRILEDHELGERLFKPIARRMNWSGFGSTPHPFFAVEVELSFFVSRQGEETGAPAQSAANIGAGAGAPAADANAPRSVDELLKVVSEAPDRLSALERVLAMVPFDRTRASKHLGLGSTRSAFELADRIVDCVRGERGSSPSANEQQQPKQPRQAPAATTTTVQAIVAAIAQAPDDERAAVLVDDLRGMERSELASFLGISAHEAATQRDDVVRRARDGSISSGMVGPR